MSTPIYVAVNQTVSPVVLTQLRLTVPASSTVNLTNTNDVWRIQADDELLALVTDDTLLINDGTTTLSKASSLQYLTPIAAKNDLTNVETGANITDWTNVSTALGGQAGANTNYVFKSNGVGSGSMVPNTQVIAHRYTVGNSGDVNYNSIATAILAAIAAGASATNPYEITVFPGTYTEAPMMVQAGIMVVATHSARMNQVFVVASNPAADLFTVTGGSITGMMVSGVSDPTKCLFRATGAASVLTLYGVAVRNCSNGIILSNGATALLNSFMISISGASQSVTTGITATGVGTHLICNSMFCASPAALLPLYAINPIQTVISVNDHADAFFNSLIAGSAYKDNTADVIFADGGSTVSLTSGYLATSNNAVHIGSSGTDTKITIAGTIFSGNVLNCYIESVTGVIFGNFTADVEANNLVAGSQLIGIIQHLTAEEMHIVGNTKFRFANTLKELDLTDYFYDFSSTGASDGGDVTDAGGLFVDVAAGEGFIRRGTPYFDTARVTWTGSSGLAIAPNTTNYVYYDSTDNSVKVGASSPGETGILLGQNVTNGSSIRFRHHTGFDLSNIPSKLNEYLRDTLPVTWKTGLACSQGISTGSFGISSGTFYYAMEPLSYNGSGVNATGSYFYGSNGVSEVANISELDIFNYDVSGSLSPMTTNYYRQDSVYLTSDGRISIIYGTNEYASSSLAQTATLNAKPSFLQPTACPIAKIIVKKDIGIDAIVDSRPDHYAALMNAMNSSGGGAGGGGGGATSHSALSDLDKPADHTWAFLVNGTRPMTGDLQMGSQNIITSGTVAGINVAFHASRHNPGGSDALSHGIPVIVLVGAPVASGSASSYALSDHQHGVAIGTPVSVDITNFSGSASTVAASDHVHSHGNQTVGTHHAIAISGSTAGFISGADKGKLDSVSEFAAALTSASPANVTKATAAIGIASTAARSDHKHDISTASPTNGLGSGSAEGSATTLARSDHEHNHTGLRQLIHFIDGGPAEGFASGAYREVLPAGDPFPTSVTWYTTSGKIHKIVEKLITLGGNKFPTQIQWKVYNSSDILLASVTDAYDYTGGNLMTPKITRTIA